MVQSDQEKVIRLKEFAKSFKGKRDSALSTLSLHQKILEDAQNKADTLSTCISAACSRHVENVSEIVERLNLGNVQDLATPAPGYNSNILSDKFIVTNHPATGVPGSLYSPFSVCVKPINQFESDAFVYDTFDTEAMMLRPDIAGCYVNLKTDDTYPNYGDVQIAQAVQETNITEYGHAIPRALVNSAAYNTRLSAWSIHAPLTGRPSVIKHPTEEADTNSAFNGEQTFDTQTGALTLFFKLNHMNNPWFQYPSDAQNGAYEEYGRGLPGVGFTSKDTSLNNVAKTLIGQKPNAGSMLSYLGHYGSSFGNHFLGILERQFACTSDVTSVGEKCLVSGPGAFFIFCPKAISQHGYNDMFVQTGIDLGQSPAKRTFNENAGYTDLIYCETGDIQNYTTSDRENALLDFTDDPSLWLYPKIGEKSNGGPSFKHGTKNGDTDYSVFPDVAGGKDVYFTCMLTNKSYESSYNVYDHRISATAVYEFEDYLKTKLGYDLTDCVFVFVTHPTYSTDRSHLPYTWPDELGTKWKTTPWVGVHDFSPRPMDHVLHTDGWFVANDGGYEHFLTPNSGYGSTQVMGFNTLGYDGETFSDYYSYSYNFPVLDHSGSPFSNYDYVYRHNCSPANISSNDTLWLIDRQQPIYHFLIRDLAHPRTGVAVTISGMNQVMPILEQNAAMYEEMEYESATQDSSNVADNALENCLFDNYTGISTIQGSVMIENIKDGTINPIKGSIMTISKKAELDT